MVVAVELGVVEEPSEAVAERDRQWEVRRHSIGLRLRRLAHRHRPHGRMWVAVVPEQAIGQRHNRDHDPVAERLLAHDRRRSRVLVLAAQREAELDREKESAPARGPRIVRLQEQAKGFRLERVLHSNRQSCRDWEQVRPRVL